MADINLVPQEERAHERFDRVARRLQFASVTLLVFTAAVIVWTLVAYTRAVTAKNQLVDQISDATLKINQYKAQEELLVVTKDKVSTAEKILTTRAEYDNFLKKLATLVPQGVAFLDMKVGDDKLVVTGRAKSSSDVAGLVSSLVSAKGAEILNQVAVDSLSSDDKGIYSFILSAKMVIKQ